jgi:OOP family OmpA-OmpF porin
VSSREYSALAFKLSAIGLAMLGSTLSGQAMAQWMPGYVGANIGRTTSNFDNAPGTTPPAALTLTGEDDRERGVKVYGGWQFHRNFAVEAGVYDLGRFDYSYGAPGGTISGNTRYRGLNLDLVGIVPFSDRFSGFARVGGTYTWARSNVGTTGVFTGGGSRRERDADWKYGVGLEYAFTPSWALRAEWERYHLEDPARGRGRVDMASIGVVYRFGATPVAAPARIISAPPPAPAPAPAPRVVPPPPPPAPMASPPPPPPPPAPAPAPRPYRN